MSFTNVSLSISLTEQIDRKKMDIILKNFNRLYDEKKLGRFVDTSKGYTEIQDKNTVLSILKNFDKKIKKQIDTVFKPPISKNSFKRGRLFGRDSLQGMSRVIRHTLIRDLQWDLDMVNCHVVIYRDWCIKNSASHSALDYYNDNRDILLKELVDKKIATSRDEAKKIPLIMMNNKPYSCFPRAYPKWLKDFYDELQFNRPNILLQHSEINKLSHDKDTDNPVGTGFNYYLTMKENELLQILYNECKSAGLTVRCLCFDGLTVDKKKNFDLKEFLAKVELLLHEHCADMKLKEKVMDEGIDQAYLDSLTSDDDVNIKKIEKQLGEPYSNKFNNNDTMSFMDFYKTHHQVIYPSFNDMVLSVMNDIPKLFIYIPHLNTIFYLKEKIWEECGCIAITFKYIDTRGSEQCFEWGQFHKQFVRFFPCYSKVVFKPLDHGVEEDEFNIWTGFQAQEVEKVDDDKVQPYLTHLRHLAPNDIHYNYLLSWFASIVQRPYEETGILVLLQGGQGAGKTILADVFRRMIIGDKMGKQMEGLDDLLQKHNDYIQGLLFLNLNELSSLGGSNNFHRNFDKLKSFITDDVMKIEPKGQKSYFIENYMNIMATTNNVFTLKVEDGCRRSFAVK